MTPDELRKIRAWLNVSYTTLAREVGVSRRTMIRWEQGDTAIPGPAARLLRAIRPAKPLRPKHTPRTTPITPEELAANAAKVQAARRARLDALK